jgi:SAM-dependent methyltransferase
MSDIEPCGTKTQSDLIREWDRLADERHRQIVSGEDLSFEYVLTPTVFKLLDGADLSVVLDIGSGTGDLTLRLASISKRVIGIEPSAASVRLANANRGEITNVTYIQSTFERASRAILLERPTAAVLAMTLMTAPDLISLAKSLASTLAGDSQVVATLSHPCFWPRYWGYDQESWYRYDQETFIEAPFVISRSRTAYRSTHIHRPLQKYVDVFADAGFRLIRLVEPVPKPEVQALYPERWRFPRFLGLKWERLF